MIDGGTWDSSGRFRSQSVTDDQWSQLLAAQGHPQMPTSQQDPRGRFNTVGPGTGAAGDGSFRGPPNRGMMSSSSVCDINALMQQQQQQQQHSQQQQAMHQHQMQHGGGMHPVSLLVLPDIDCDKGVFLLFCRITNILAYATYGTQTYLVSFLCVIYKVKF